MQNLFILLCCTKKKHVHHLDIKGVAKKTKKKKKIRPTYPISKKSVTGNIQLIFLGLISNHAEFCFKTYCPA